MTVRERVAAVKPPFPHVCQFFDSLESRAEAVAAFVEPGLRSGESALVIARPVHWTAISSRLEKRGVVVAEEVDRGRLVVKDATETLGRIAATGTPSLAAFRDTLGPTLDEVLARGKVRAYGEMVDILAQRGELDETLRLEDLWNRAAGDNRLTLFCGYSSAHFVSPATHQAMRGICAAHGDVWRAEDDAMANWLLTASHNSIRSSLSH
jgi:hypothetical protein